MKKTLAAIMVMAAGAALASTTFSGLLDLSNTWKHRKTAGSSTLEETFDSFLNWRHATGAGANQMETIVVDSVALTNAQTRTVNLLDCTNGFGDKVTFATVRFMAITAAAANVDNIEVGGAATAAFVNWVADASDKIVIRPGGIALFAAPDATGYAVGTNGSLKITNAGTNSNVYVLYVGGGE
jgi:hypothetical protein